MFTFYLRHPAAPGSRLDLARRSVNLRDGVAVVADASLSLCIGTASTLPALACSIQKLLLLDAGRYGHGSMPLSPGRGDERPGQRACCLHAEPACGPATIDAVGRGHLVRIRSRRRMGK